MTTRPRNSDHPEVDILLDHAEKRLAGAEARRVAEHLESCRRCRGRLEELGHLASSLGGPLIEAPPEWLANWADDLPRMHPRRAPARGFPSFRLVFDSWQAATVGARGATQTSRRLLFRAGSVDLDIELEIPAGRTDAVIQGQVLDASVPGGRVFEKGEARLVSGRRTVMRAPLDAHGRFRLSGVPRRRYQLHLQATGFKLQLPEIEA